MTRTSKGKRGRAPLALGLVAALLAVALVVGWRWMPPAADTMDGVRAADVGYRLSMTPEAPDGATPGEPLTKAQVDALEADIGALLDTYCTEGYRQDLARAGHTPRRMARSVAAHVRAGDWPPDHPYAYLRDLVFCYRTWTGGLVFEVYEVGRLQGERPGRLPAAPPTERLRFEKVDGGWRLADVTHLANG